MITTHNRLQDLQRTCERLRELSPPPDEWLFTADGCVDGTEAWLRAEFPEAKIFSNQPGLGSVPSRDRMIRATTCDLILSLDDDSYPLARDALATLKIFLHQRPEVGVVSLPQRTDEYPETHSHENFGQERQVGSYSSCAACLRRETYLATEGYPSFFSHIYEEPDFALQAIAAGWQVIWFPKVIIRHHYSPVGRNELSIHQKHARNEAWSVLMRCPLPWMPFVLAGKALSQASYAARRGASWLVREPKWWVESFIGWKQALRMRKPLPWSAYRAWIRASK